MKNKAISLILNNLLILTLLLSSLYATAFPRPAAAAALELNVVPFTLSHNGGGAAAWTTGAFHTGSYSVQLSTTSAVGDYAGFGLSPYSGTINAITGLSFWYKDISYDTFSGPRLGLTLTNGSNHYMAMTGCAVDSGAWKNADAIAGVKDTDWYTTGTGSQIWWYGTWDGSNPATYSSVAGPINFASLVTALTGSTVNNVAVYMGVVDGSTVLAGSAYIDDPAINGTTYYGMIQDAIDSAADGDTINVAAGSYNENLTVNKSLTLLGAGSGTTTVTAGSPTVSVFTVTTSNVNISGFRATGTQMSGNQGYAGIRFGAGVTGCNIHDNNVSVNQYGILMVEVVGDITLGNNIFNHNTASSCVVSGIEMQNTYGNTFTNNTANSNGSYGIRLANASNNMFIGNTTNSNGVNGFMLVRASGTTGSSNNTFINNTANLNTSYGFREDYGDLNVLTGNTFDANVVDGGIKLKETITNISVTNNNITNNPIGIEVAFSTVQPDVTTWVVNNNNITGNTTYGISNIGNLGTLNARQNYWGNASGPGHDLLAYGDNVSANINYMPWLTAAATTTPALTITTLSLPNGDLNVPYSQSLAAIGGTPPYQWFQYSGVPAWLTISPTGVVSGTPAEAGPVPFNVQVRAAGQGIWKTVQLYVATTPLEITTTSLPPGDVKYTYSQTLYASGGSGIYTTWSVVGGSLPPDLSITNTDNVTGLISGTPNTAGSYPFTVQVEDSWHNIDTKEFSIYISDTPLDITQPSLPAGNVGSPYSETVTVTGGTGVYTWSVVIGSLPIGLSLNGDTGVISGTPTTVGTSDLTVRVDDGSMTDDQFYSLVINPPLAHITTTSLPDGHIGLAYSKQLQASGGTGTYTWSLLSGSLPPGLGPLTSGGLIAGTPNTAGSYPFTVQLTDTVTTVTKVLSIDVLSKMLGTSQDPATQFTTASDYLVMGKFKAVSNGNATQIRVKCTTTGNVKVGLYTDLAGYPYTRMSDNSTGVAVTAGWNDIPIPAATVEFGKPYWIVCNSNTNCVGSDNTTGYTIMYLPYAYTNPGLPASVGAGATTSNNRQLLAGSWGTDTGTDLTILTESLPDGNKNVAYSQTLQAAGGTTPYTWSLLSGSLPPGLSITDNVTGIIAGTPTSSVTTIYPFTVQVTDNVSAMANKLLSITINVPQVKLVGTDSTSATLSLGANYLSLTRFQAVASGSAATFKVYSANSGHVKVAIYADSAGQPEALMGYNDSGTAIVAGWNSITIPAIPSTYIAAGSYYWLAIDSDTTLTCVASSVGGTIRYRPATYSGFTFPDPAGSFSSASGIIGLLAVWGSPGPPPLSITTTHLPDGVVNSAYSQTLAATGGITPYTWALAPGSGPLPPGLDPITPAGVISGTPTTEGTYPFTVQVTDNVLAEATKSLSITVSNRLFGADDATATNTAPKDALSMARFQSSATGYVTAIRVKCTTTGNVRVGLYTDDAAHGRPGNLMIDNSPGTAVTVGWNSIDINDTGVMKDWYYWIVCNSDVDCIGTAGVTGVSTSYLSPYAYTNPLPGSVSGVTSTSTDTQLLVQAMGTAETIPLDITTTSLTGGTVNTSYSQTLEAFGGTGSYTWFLDDGSGPLPPGLSLASATGIISGMPTTSGAYPFTARVFDGPDNDTELLTITIQGTRLVGIDDYPPNLALGANYLSLTRFQATATGNVVTFKVNSSGPANVKVAIYADNGGQPGALRNAVNTGTPIVAGLNSIAITSTPVTAGNYYWLAINSDTTINCTTYLLGGNIRYKSDPYAGFEFPNPAGSGFTPGSGIIALLGGYGDLVVLPLDIATTSPLPNGTNGVTYSQTLVATGGTGSYTWSLAPGSDPLPPNLTLTAGGVISGIPTTTGTSSFTVRVNDGPNHVDKLLSLPIVDRPPLAITTTPPLPDGTVSTAYSQQLEASGGFGTYTWSLVSGSLPPGLGALPASGLISGTPTAAGTYPFTVQVDDGSTTASKELSITIVALPSTKLVGADDATPSQVLGAGYFSLTRFQAVVSGDVVTLKVKSDKSANVKVAIYSDSVGSPNARLSAVNTGTPIVAGWNDITITAAHVNASSYYWLAINSDTSIKCAAPSTGGIIRYKSAPYASFTFPNPAGSGFYQASNYIDLLAGWSQ